MAIKFDTFKTGGGSAPTGGLVYKGSYDAATQSPNLTSSLKGDFYIVSVAGSLATIPLNVGDHIVFNQNASSPITSAMFDVIDNTDAVASVNSQTGVVVLDSDDITEGSSNQYFTSARFTSEFNTKDTDSLTEGSSNLYYTNARFDTQLGTKTTTDLAEGSNLYHTNARVDARIAAATANDLSDVSYTAGAGIDGYVLKYNNTSGNWEAQAESGGSVGTLQQVTDQGATTTTNISTAQITLGGDLLADGVLTRTIGDETNRFITSYSDLNGAIRFKAKAGVALSKGDVVYISGVSGGVPTVDKAQANSASTMPAFGVCYAAASLNAEVQIVSFGNLEGINTGTCSVGDTLFVSETTAGAITKTAPTGETNLIQNIGKVVKVDAVGSSGIYKIGGAGRTNATPNLDSGKIFLGNGSNQAVSTALSAINLSSFNQDLSTTNVSEGTNLYYTDARADARIAAATANDLSDVSYTAGASIDGFVMKYNNTSGNWEAQAESGGGASQLNDLSDVTISSVTNGDTLVYNSSTSVFENIEPHQNVSVLSTSASAKTASANEFILIPDGHNASSLSINLPDAPSIGSTVTIARGGNTTSSDIYVKCSNISGRIFVFDQLTPSGSRNDKVYIDAFTVVKFTLISGSGATAVWYADFGLNTLFPLSLTKSSTTDDYKLNVANGSLLQFNTSAGSTGIGAFEDVSISTINLSSFNDDLATNIVDDTTPQLGGNLDVNGNDVISVSNGAINLAPDGTGKVTIKGNATGGSGQIVLNCEQNSHGITLKGPPHSAAATYTLTFPNTDGTADQVLKTDGSGNLDWVNQASGGGGFTYDGTQGAASFNAVLSYHYAVNTSGASANITMTLPAASSGGSEIRVKLLDATYSVIVAVQTGETLDTTTNGTTTLSVANQSITLVDNGSTGWEIV